MNIFVSSNTRFVTLSALLGAMAVIGEPTVAQAGAVTFTWAPSAIAGVGNGASTFSADSIVIKNYIRTTNVNNLTILKQTFSGSQYETVSGFTLNGAPVNATGFGTNYGLYFAITPAGSFPINSSGATVGPATYTQLDVTLYADVGADDGTVSTGPSGIGFSNPAGTANDIALATGSLISAALAVTPTGGRTATYALTFQPLAGESGFFASPGIPLSLQVSLLTPAAAFAITPVNSTTVISTADGNLGSGGTIQLVPEPASIAVLAAGLLGLVSLRRRGRSTDSAAGDQKRHTKRRASMCITLIRRLALGFTIAAGPSAIASAAPIVFTLDPSKAVPALTGGPAAFTADAFQYLNFNRTTNFNDTTTLKQTVNADQYQPVTGFTLGGSPVSAPGFNSAYGLYFRLTSTFTFPINNLGVTIGPPTYITLNVSLISDVNNDDGALSTSASRIGFSNATGVANDVTLATGSLISASLSSNPDGSRRGEFVTNFAAAPGESGFFGLSGAVILDEIGNTALAAFSVVPIDNQNFLTLVNGNLSPGTAQLVPVAEPTSIAMLVAGLLGFGCARRQRLR